LFRYNPLKEKGRRFLLDSKEPSVALDAFLYHENRFATIKNGNPEKGAEFLTMARDAMQYRWEKIQALKAL
jgi:pyruvate-ferredoxin/flavodoxin oxidoreductase